MNALDTFKRHYQDRWNADTVTQGWDARGGRIVGYPDVNCPEEIIMAADCLPLMMTGTPDSGLPTAGLRVDRGSSLPVRYLYEAILTGRYDFVDLIVTMGGDRWIANVHGFLEEERRIDPGVKFGDCYYLERLRTPYQQHRDFNLARLHDFKEFLEDYAGRKITTAALSEAIAVTNESRLLLQRVSALRTMDAPRLSGSDALAVISGAMLMPKARFNALLREFLERDAERMAPAPAGHVRLFMSGSIVDNLRLYQALESLPVVIVGEDTALGDRYAHELVSPVLEPMEALADRYTYKPLDPWMLGMKERIKWRLEAARAAQAQAVVFFHLENDDPVAWDYPDQKRVFEAAGIPVLTFFDQDYELANRSDISDAVAEFVRSLR